MGRSIIIEVHGWRGFHIDGGPLGTVLVVGFVSASYMPFLLTDWLKDKIARLKNVAGDTRGFVEMSAWDEGGSEQSNDSKGNVVPWGGRKIHK